MKQGSEVEIPSEEKLAAEQAQKEKDSGCDKHGHVPVGWTGSVYCELCGKFLYNDNDEDDV